MEEAKYGVRDAAPYTDEEENRLRMRARPDCHNGFPITRMFHLETETRDPLWTSMWVNLEQVRAPRSVSPIHIQKRTRTQLWLK